MPLGKTVSRPGAGLGFVELRVTERADFSVSHATLVRGGGVFPAFPIFFLATFSCWIVSESRATKSQWGKSRPAGDGMKEATAIVTSN